MRIAYVGATGAVGKVVVPELSRRGLEVTAITTHPEQVEDLPHVTARAGDANDGPALAGLLKGHDVVVTSIQFAKTDPDVLIEAVKASGVPRYVVAGGSGTLLAPGTNTRLMDTPTFPANFAAPRPPPRASSTDFSARPSSPGPTSPRRPASLRARRRDGSG